MNQRFSFRFAFVVSCILLAAGYILARLHCGESVQIQVVPLKASPVIESALSMESGFVESGSSLQKIAE